MRCLRDRSGVAALELALVAPILITLMIGSIDIGAAQLRQAQITRPLAASAEYATLAGQNNVAQATIISNAKTLAGALTGPFIGAPTVMSAVLNNNAAAGSTCCPGSTWTCSTVSGYACADGSTAGVYLTIKASYPFKALIAADTNLVGTTLSASIVARLQ